MSCNECGEKPKKACGAFPKAVIEIDNPEKIVLLRKMMVPASMGGREEFPPTIGKYHNVLLEYEADGSLFLYSSDGIPTQLSTDVTDLQRQLNALGLRIDNEHIERVTAVDAEADARRDADNTLGSRITALDDSLATVAKTGSYNDLSNKPTIGNGTLTVKRNGTSLGTFKANATANTDVNVVVPTKTSDLTNDGEDGTSKYVEVGDLSTVATSGSYNDLANKPTIGDATITIQKNGASVGNFKTNATANKSINVTVPTKTSDLTNDGEDGTSTYVEAGDLSTVATSGSYNDLTNKPAIDTALSTSSNNAVRNSTISNALNRNVMTDISVNSNASTTTVQIDGAKRNLYSGATSTKKLALPVASSTEAGVMNSATFDAVTSNTNNINAIMNGAVAVPNLPASPTQAELTTAWENETGLTSLINRASVYDVTNNKVWTYYTNDQTWHAASNTSQVTVNTFTNSSEGTIKGSTNVGQVFAENDGTGSVNGWDSLSNSVSANTSNISSLQTTVAGKQDTLTAGSNISISNNTISATDTKYTAGNGLNLNGTTFSVNTSVIATKSEIPTKTSDLTNDGASGTSTFIEADDLSTVATTGSYNDLTNKPTIPTVNNATLTIQKNGTNVQTFTANSSTNKTANITVPTAVSELTNDSGYATTTQLNDGLATKQNTLTAGDNIQINGNTISAANTTYTAGNAIDIINGEISADIYPADFFTADSTIENCGSDEDIDGTISASLKSVELKGDTFQQTYTGKNLLPYPYKDGGSKVAKGITFTAAPNGSVTLNGTNDGTGNSAYMLYNDASSPLQFEAGTYYFAPPSNTSIDYVMFDGTTYLNFNSSNNYSWVFPSIKSIRQLYIQVPKNNTTVFNDLKIYPMLTTLPNQTEADYEPYVGGIASPSPDYPQDVQVVTGEQTVNVAGKNLFDINNRNEIGGYFDGSQAVSTIVIGTAGRNRVIYIPCRPGTTYSFSFADLTDMNPPQVGTTTETPDSGVTVNRLGVVSSSTLKLEGSTTPNDAKYIVVRFQTKYTSVDISTALANCLSKFQIEQSQTATSYETYQSQSYMINLDGNLYDRNSAYKQGNDARLDIALKPNTTYVFDTGRAWTGAFLYDSNNTQTRKVGNDASSTHSVEFTTTAEEVKATLTFYIGSADIETYDFTGVIFYEVGIQIELCKIGDYQDYIYKGSDGWYVHKEINKATLPTSGYTRWSTHPEACIFYKNGVLSDALFQGGTVTTVIGNLVVQPQVVDITTYYNNYAQTNEYGFVLKTGTPGIVIQNKDTASLDDFHTWISSNSIEVRYVLATPTDTKITNATLVAQLNALANAQTYNDRTTIVVAATSPNLPTSLCVEAYRDSEAGLIELISTKQGPLTAGNNITIEDGVISATNTQYTAGTGLALNGTTLSVDTSVIAQKSDIPTVNNATLTIQKNGTNVQTFTANSKSNKTANITVPTKVSELTNDSSFATTTQLNTGLAAKQNTLSAGSNITISGNTISAIDTKYTAGTGISISNGVISCTFANGNPINY